MWLCIIWQRGSLKRMSHIFMALQCILNSRVTSVEVFCWRVAKMLRKETVGGRFGCILLFDHIWREVAGRFICIHSSPLEMIGAGDPPPITHLVKGDCATDCQNNLHHVLLFSINSIYIIYIDFWHVPVCLSTVIVGKQSLFWNVDSTIYLELSEL